MRFPYGKQLIDKEDRQAVLAVLESDWLTTGPKVPEFESAVCKFTGAKFGVAVSSGTAALHAAMFAVGIGPGDEVIVPPLTFAATANAVIYMGAMPVFADVDAETLLIDPDEIEKKISPKTKAIITVDYAGQSCDYDRIRKLAGSRGLILVADACHSLGGSFQGASVGTLADITCLSFHPVKNITTGEGGMLLTDNEQYASAAKLFRNHGITSDHRQRAEKGILEYEMTALGFNYRITDIQCALGISQLKKIEKWTERRNELARHYNAALEKSSVRPLKELGDRVSGRHLFVVRLPDGGRSRRAVVSDLREKGIGVNVHYPPVHLHPYYRNKYGYAPGSFPRCEAAYECILSLPMYVSLDRNDVEYISAELIGAVEDASGR